MLSFPNYQLPVLSAVLAASLTSLYPGNAAQASVTEGSSNSAKVVQEPSSAPPEVRETQTLTADGKVANTDEPSSAGRDTYQGGADKSDPEADARNKNNTSHADKSATAAGKSREEASSSAPVAKAQFIGFSAGFGSLYYWDPSVLSPSVSLIASFEYRQDIAENIFLRGSALIANTLTSDNTSAFGIDAELSFGYRFWDSAFSPYTYAGITMGNSGQLTSTSPDYSTTYTIPNHFRVGANFAFGFILDRYKKIRQIFELHCYQGFNGFTATGQPTAGGGTTTTYQYNPLEFQVLYGLGW